MGETDCLRRMSAFRDGIIVTEDKGRRHRFRFPSRSVIEKQRKETTGPPAWLPDARRPFGNSPQGIPEMPRLTHIAQPHPHLLDKPDLPEPSIASLEAKPAQLLINGRVRSIEVERTPDPNVWTITKLEETRGNAISAIMTNYTRRSCEIVIRDGGEVILTFASMEC